MKAKRKRPARITAEIYGPVIINAVHQCAQDQRRTVNNAINLIVRYGLMQMGYAVEPVTPVAPEDKPE